MMIKVMRYFAKEPQRPRDLARLLRYLFAARSGDEEVDAFVRLAGPPFVRRLIQRCIPWGTDVGNAADDLAHQMFAHARAGCSDFDLLPRHVYSHVVLSFSPRLRRGVDTKTPRATDAGRTESTYSRSLRIVLDLLENLGVGEHFPMVVVVHGDRRHLHAHVVLGHFVAGSPSCKLHLLNSSTLRSFARQVALVYQLPGASRVLRDRHHRAVGANFRG